MSTVRAPRLALCLEQTLGHRAHGQNLERVATGPEFAADIVRVEYPASPRLRVPWALRGSAAAVQQLRRRRRADVTLFHTQTISLFAPVAAHRGRYAVSVDATPLQVDTMGRWYHHRRGPVAVERLKQHWYRSTLGRAAGVVAWSQWAAESLMTEYGVEGGRILVAPPGAPPAFFGVERREKVGGRPVILFVGGDFERKGGPALLEAFAPLAGRAELLLVTEADVLPSPGVEVLHGVRPGTDAQRAAFARADIFCLPTVSDCTSVALQEAMAAGLPVVTTRVGSNEETVRTGETGVLVAPGDTSELGEVLRMLVDDAGLRHRLGAAARDDARTRMDATLNAERVMRFLQEAA